MDLPALLPQSGRSHGRALRGMFRMRTLDPAGIFRGGTRGFCCPNWYRVLMSNRTPPREKNQLPNPYHLTMPSLPIHSPRPDNDRGDPGIRRETRFPHPRPRSNARWIRSALPPDPTAPSHNHPGKKSRSPRPRFAKSSRRRQPAGFPPLTPGNSTLFCTRAPLSLIR